VLDSRCVNLQSIVRVNGIVADHLNMSFDISHRHCGMESKPKYRTLQTVWDTRCDKIVTTIAKETPSVVQFWPKSGTGPKSSMHWKLKMALFYPKVTEKAPNYEVLRFGLLKLSFFEWWTMVSLFRMFMQPGLMFMQNRKELTIGISPLNICPCSVMSRFKGQ
jgi:hypothetical protein